MISLDPSGPPLEHGKGTNLPQGSMWLEEESEYLNITEAETSEN